MVRVNHTLFNYRKEYYNGKTDKEIDWYYDANTYVSCYRRGITGKY